MDFFGSDIKAYDNNALNMTKLIPIFVYVNDQLYDPYSVKYSIYGVCGKPLQSNEEASRFSVGEYYANFNWMSQIQTLLAGTFKIIWEIQEYQFSQLVSITDEFSVYKQKQETCQASHIPTGFDNSKRQSGTCNMPDYGYKNAVYKYAYAPYYQAGISCGYSSVSFRRQSGSCNYPFC